MVQHYLTRKQKVRYTLQFMMQMADEAHHAKDRWKALCLATGKALMPGASISWTSQWTQRTAYRKSRVVLDKENVTEQQACDTGAPTRIGS